MCLVRSSTLHSHLAQNRALADPSDRATFLLIYCSTGSTTSIILLQNNPKNAREWYHLGILPNMSEKKGA